jgi:hypothetical protein
MVTRMLHCLQVQFDWLSLFVLVFLRVFAFMTPVFYQNTLEPQGHPGGA